MMIQNDENFRENLFQSKIQMPSFSFVIHAQLD